LFVNQGLNLAYALTHADLRSIVTFPNHYTIGCSGAACVMERKSVIDFWKRNVRGVGGTHGYDPAVASMWTRQLLANSVLR
jgi:hypothetical protein